MRNAPETTSRFAGATLAQRSAGERCRGSRPNIVLILADDLGYGDLGCTGHPRNQTPSIDRLAREGLRFSDFHANGPMCSPTRAALLTGCYQQRLGRHFEGPLSARDTPDTGLSPDVPSLAVCLRGAGYATAMYGKWHLGYRAPFLPTRHGFDDFRGLLTGDGDHHSHISRSGTEDWYHNEDVAMEEGYSSEVITKHSIDFMREHRDEPFFLYAAHLVIHFPWQGPDEPRHRVKGRDYWNQAKLGPHPEGSVAPVVRKMVAAVDESVRDIMAAIEDLGISERTLVFFTSDNGGYTHYQGRFRDEVSSNAPWRGQKGDLYEGGHRVPAVAWWPGHIEPGNVTDETTMTMDLMPTFLELADAKPPEPMDGASMAPLLLGGQPMPVRDFFWRKGSDRAVRRGPWKLLESAHGVELHNLDDDVGETRDLCGEYPALATQLRESLREWEDDVDGES